MFTINIIFIALFGLCFGSFITMASYRFALENITVRDFVFKNSFCPSCHNQLKVKHLFPVFSWLFFKGKCGFCATKISPRYPLIEIATSLLFVAIFLACGATIDIRLVLILLMSVALMIMVVVDLENYFIPDFMQIILGILILIYHLVIPDKHNLTHYFLSAITFFVFGLAIHFGFMLLTKKQGIGEDDLKFFTFAGFMIGIDQMMVFMILNGILGIIFGAVWVRLKKDDTFPFAPALAASFLICVLFKIDYVQYFGMALYWFEKYVTKTAY